MDGTSLMLSLLALSIINHVVGKNRKIEIRVKKSEINVSIKIIGNEKEPAKIGQKMKAFLERFSKRTSSKKPKNLAELIQEVIEADKEANQIQDDGKNDTDEQQFKFCPRLSALSNVKPETIPLFMSDCIDGLLVLNEVELEALRHGLMDLKIVVLAICGPSRGGKSTLLCFVVRFLKYLVELDHFPSQEEVKAFDWLRNGPKFLERVFDYGAGVHPFTNGIQLWSEPFIIGDVAYLLMDVQGLFDSNTKPQGNAKLCTLAMLLSSDLIYNVHFVSLTTDILERIFTFVNYAREMVRSNPEQEAPPTKFLQNFYLVGRDFESPQNYEYGWEGGTNYLNDELDKNVYRDMKQAFGEYFTCLMCAVLPRPGKKIIHPDWTGRISDFRAKFLNEVKSFVETLFGHLAVKQTASGNPMTFSEWLDCLKLYTDLFNKGDLLEYEGFCQAQIKAHLRNVIETSQTIFNERFLVMLIEIERNNAEKPKTNEQVAECLKKSKTQAMSEFGKLARLGTLRQINEHRAALEKKLQEETEDILKSNIKELHLAKLDSQFRTTLILLAGGFVVGGGLGLVAAVGAGALVGAGLIEGTGVIGGTVKAIGGAKLVTSLSGLAIGAVPGAKSMLRCAKTRKEVDDNKHAELAKELTETCKEL